MKRFAWIAAFLLAVPAFGQDELVLKGDLTTVKVAEVVTVYHERSAVKSFPFTIEAPKGAVRPSWTVPAGVTWTTSGRVLNVTSAPKGDLKIGSEWAVIDFVKMETRDVSASIMVLVGVDPPAPIPPLPPDPKPPIPPDPKPVPPKPVPVTSFRVIFVAESAKTLTKEQNSVIAGKAVRDWLTANTTPEGAFAGWRHFDPQQTVANESPSMKGLWEAVQPKLSGLPCVAIEVNGHAEIIPLAATPAEMLATFQKYKGGA